MNYDPTIQGHLLNAKERWGSPEENRKLLVPYGIPLFDREFWGIGVDRGGEMVLVIGEEKNRKTTLLINIIINYMTNPKVVNKPKTLIDTLESGMPPERYTDQLICNLASRHLIELGHVPIAHGSCPICGVSQCNQLRLTPEFLRYMQRSEQQLKAVDLAIEQMNEWPLLIYGPGIEQGDARNLKAAVDMEKHDGRWNKAVEEEGVQIIVPDHVQQYRYYNEIVTDYEKMTRAINAYGDFVSSYGSSYSVVLFAISQVSLTSLREKKSGGKMKAMGGKKGHEEATRIISSSYEEMSGYLGTVIEGSRTSGVGFAKYPIDDVSGAMFNIQ